MTLNVQSLPLARRPAVRLPSPVAVLATAVAATVSLLPLYLVVRATGQGAGIWDTLTEQSAVQALVRTVWLTATVTSSGVVIGVLFAWLTVRTDLPFRNVWAVVAALPLAIPSFVGGFVVISALGPGGMLQDVLSPLGVESLPSLYGFTGAWLTITFLTYPYVYLPVRGALRQIDPATEEVARSLGKSRLVSFARVLLPQLRPAITAGALLVALYTLSEFGAVSLLRYDTLTPLVYIQYTAAFDRTSAAALALPLLFLAVLLLVLDGATQGRMRYYGSSQARRATVARLGLWRWPALAFCTGVTGIGLGMPLAVISYWLVRGVTSGESVGFVGHAALNSAYASGLAALAAVGAALPVAILSARRPGWYSRLVERTTYAGFALPAITIALALVFFAANYATFAYQTLGLLVLAYVVRFLPQAIGACRGSLQQINPNTEEAARGLGFGPVRVFTRVTGPQMMPGMSAGAVLVFLTAMKELPVTLLLAPIGFETLSTQVWSATSEAFFTRAAVPALLLVALSAIPMIFTVLREEK